MYVRPDRREQCRFLADRLIVEYAGCVPPGQVLAVVVRAYRRLARQADLSTDALMAICESSARRALTDRTATASQSQQLTAR